MSETDATPDLPASQPYPVIGETISASLDAAVVIAASEPRIEPTRRVLFVTPEIADFVKVGGLGDVSAALPRSLRHSCDVRVLVPGYRQMLHRRDEIEIVGILPGLAGIPQCGLGRLVLADGLVIYVVLCDELYDRDGTPYNDAQGGDLGDNDIRFARLSLAATDMAGGLGDSDWVPDLIHANGAGAGLCAMARHPQGLAAHSAQPRLSGASSSRIAGM